MTEVFKQLICIFFWLAMLIKPYFMSLTVLSVQPKAPLYWWAGGQTGFLMNLGLILFPKFIFSCFILFQHRGDLTVFEIWRACWIMSGVPHPNSVPLFHFRFHASSASPSRAFTPTEHGSRGIFCSWSLSSRMSRCNSLSVAHICCLRQNKGNCLLFQTINRT